MNLLDGFEAVRPLGLTIALASVGGFLFFTFNRNARLKRRTWPVFNIVVGVLILVVSLAMGFPDLWIIAFVPILIVIVIVTIRSTRFCETCGATLRRQPVLRRTASCPRCAGPMDGPKR